MTLEDQIKLIDDMIKEDPGSIIKDFVELMSEIEVISKITDDQEHNRRFEQLFIRRHF